MSDLRRQRAEELFQQAADLSKPERDGFLSWACADDTRLRTEVQTLLAQLDDGAEFLEKPAYTRPPCGEDEPGPIPTQLGRYRILRLIGEGGMGSVYEAEQENPRRTVALKVIRAAFVSEGLLRRFEHEAWVLGQLHHVGIAQIYEAGAIDTPHGRQPFFAMELIRGKPLNQYAEEARLTTRQKLELIAHVCDAVQHAHAQGVIHRDLKPGNILVSDASPKILDFGVARVTQADVQALSMHTSIGQIVGTIPYMSPEQVSGDPHSIDPRSDVYALGVILYELLAGRLPYEVKHCAIAEAARIIRDEEPSRLSSIRTEFRGDVETIVQKALEKDRARRYPSAAALGADLRHFLRDEPIVARPATRLYQLRKFAKRHTELVIGLAATFAVLVAGLIGVFAYALKEAHQRHNADQSAEIARQERDKTQRLAYRASIAAAYAGLRNEDFALAQQALAAAPAVERGWEFDYLQYATDRSLLTFHIPPAEKIGMAISPDDRLLFTASGDGWIRVWDLANGRVDRTISIERGLGPATLACSPDGTKLLVVGEKEGGAYMLDITTGSVLWHTSEIVRASRAAFSPDSQSVVLGSKRGPRVVLVDAATGTEMRSIATPGFAVMEASFSPRGTQVAVVTDSGGYDVRLFDLPTERWLWDKPAVAALFSADGRTMCIQTGYLPPDTYSIVDCDSGAALASVPLSSAGGNIAAFHGSGRFLVSGDEIGTIAMYEARSGQRLTTLYRQDKLVQLEFTASGKRLVTLARDGMVKVWDAYTTNSENLAPRFDPDMGANAISAGGRMTATVGWGGVLLWDTQRGIELWRRFVTRKGLLSVAFSVDEQWIATGDEEGFVHVLTTTDGSIAARHGPLGGPVTALSWLPDHQRLLAVVGATIVEAGAGESQPHALVRSDSPIACLAITSDGRRVALGQADHAVRIHDAADGRLLATATCHEAMLTAVAFSSDGAQIASASIDGAVYLYSSRPAGSPLQLAKTGRRVRRLAFRPDGSRLAGAAEDGAIHVWDTRAGDEPLTLRTPSNPLDAVLFSPDGQTLLASGLNSAVIAFETAAPTGGFQQRELVREAHSLVTQQLNPRRETQRWAISSDVAAQVQADPTVPDDVRPIALQIIEARGDHANYDNSYAWELVRKPGRSPADYLLARRKVESSLRVFTTDYGMLNTLGVALYRVGDYPAALEALRRCDEMYRVRAGDSHPIDLLTLAMAQARLGLDAEARDALARGRALAQQAQYVDDGEVRGFLREAEAVLDATGEKGSNSIHDANAASQPAPGRSVSDR